MQAVVLDVAPHMAAANAAEILGAAKEADGGHIPTFS